MSQSFWVTKDYQTFMAYTKKLEREYLDMSDQDLRKACENWSRGAEKMKQIAIGYDTVYTPPTPAFLQYDKKDSIHWVKFNALDGFTIGLWDGPNTVIDGKPVFDPAYLDVEAAGMRKITEMDFSEAKMWFLKVMKKFDGVVIPEQADPF